MDVQKAGESNEEKFERAFALLESKEYAQALNSFLALEQDGFQHLSSSIGWIYDHIHPREVEKAKHYYMLACSEGDSHAQHALAGIFYEENNIEQAIIFYSAAANNGRAECYYPLYKLLKMRGSPSAANAALAEAVKSKDAFAIRDMSIQQLTGKDGVRNIAKGLIMYIRNVPDLIRSARRTYRGRNPS